MKIDNILIQPSPVHDKGTFVLHIEIGGNKYTGYFDTFPTFLIAVKDAAGYFAVRQGLIKGKHAQTTRPVQDVQH